VIDYNFNYAALGSRLVRRTQKFFDTVGYWGIIS